VPTHNTTKETSVSEVKRVELKELVGLDLVGFQITQMMEVFVTDDEGSKTRTVGYFKDPDIAVVFARINNGGTSRYETGPALILTNGLIGYPVNNQEPANIFDEESQVKAIRSKILSKLLPGERKILGV